MRKNRPSMTARKVAANIVALGAVPGMDRVLPRGVVDATAELLVAAGVMSPTTVRWVRSPRMASLYRAFDPLLPGQFEAFAHRKAFCERHVRDGIAAGATQVIVLGAGYDTLGWRLAPEFSKVSFFEVDEPATARRKANGLAAMGARDNLRLIAEDLGKKRLLDTLSDDDAWDRTRQTVVVAEGLVMYLSPDAVNELFSQCAAVTGPGSRMAFSYIPSGADGRPYVGRFTGLVLWLQKMVGEPWMWSIEPAKLDAFLERAGWRSAPELEESTEMRGVEYFTVVAKVSDSHRQQGTTGRTT